MTWLAWDAETYSDLDITEVGSDRYLSHPSTRLLCCAWLWDFSPTVFQWDESRGPLERCLYARNFLAALATRDVRKYAFNVAMEIGVTEKVLRIATPLESWRCTMAMAAMAGIGGSLSSVGRVLGLAEDAKKSRAGKALINLFCSPSRTTRDRRGGTWESHPDKWAEFLEYNRQDVVAEDAVRRILEGSD